MTQGNNNPQNNFNPQNMNVPQDNLNIQNGYPQAGYPQGFNQQNGYPQTGYPQNNVSWQSINNYSGYGPDNKSSRKLYKAVLIVSAIFFVIGMTIFAVVFVNKNTKKNKKNKEHLYTVEDLQAMYGYDYVDTKDYESHGISYKICYPKYSSASTHTYEYYLVFLFDSKEDAKTYFDDMKTSYFSRITTEYPNVVEGWISGICDADQKDRAELIDNIIVIKELDFIGYDW